MINNNTHSPALPLFLSLILIGEVLWSAAETKTTHILGMVRQLSSATAKNKQIAMMDPATAFSIAGGVVTFVEFGAKLVSLYAEIRRSKDGCPPNLSALETESHELQGHANEARDKIDSLRKLYPLQSDSLKRLAAKCTHVEQRLKGLLQSLTAKQSRSAQAMIAVRGLMKQKEIEDLQNQLRSIREQIMMNVILCTAYVGNFLYLDHLI